MERTSIRRVLTVQYDKEEYCYLDEDSRFPTGLLPYVVSALGVAGVEVEIDNPQEVDYHDYQIGTDYLEGVRLRDYQVSAIEKALACKRGVVKIATGGGKTEIQIAVAKALYERYGAKTLLVSPSTKSSIQTAERARVRGLKDVGLLNSFHDDYDARHIVAQVQTLYSRFKRFDDATMKLLAGVRLIQWDECHHKGAESWFLPGMTCTAEYRISYSATPFHDSPESLHPYDVRLIGVSGDLICDVPARYLIDRGFLVDPLIYMVPVMSPPLHHLDAKSVGYNTIENLGIVSNDTRNRIATTIAVNAISRGLRPVILVRKIEHGKTIMDLLRGHGVTSKLSRGGQCVWQYDNAGNLEEYPDPEDTVQEEFTSKKFDVLIGSAIYDESVDIPEINCLIICSGLKKSTRVLQRVGRAMRPETDDASTEHVEVWDFDDKTHYVLKNHSRSRAEGYAKQGFMVVREIPPTLLQDVILNA